MPPRAQRTPSLTSGQVLETGNELVPASLFELQRARQLALPAAGLLQLARSGLELCSEAADRIVYLRSRVGCRRARPFLREARQPCFDVLTASRGGIDLPSHDFEALFGLKHPALMRRQGRFQRACLRLASSQLLDGQSQLSHLGSQLRQRPVLLTRRCESRSARLTSPWRLFCRRADARLVRCGTRSNGRGYGDAEETRTEAENLHDRLPSLKRPKVWFARIGQGPSLRPPPATPQGTPDGARRASDCAKAAARLEHGRRREARRSRADRSDRMLGERPIRRRTSAGRSNHPRRPTDRRER